MDRKDDKDTKALGDLYKKLMEGGSQIDVQAKFVEMYRSFENINGDLGPEISAEEGFSTAVTEQPSFERKAVANIRFESLSSASSDRIS